MLAHRFIHASSSSSTSTTQVFFEELEKLVGTLHAYFRTCHGCDSVKMKSMLSEEISWTITEDFVLTPTDTNVCAPPTPFGMLLPHLFLLVDETSWT